MQTEHQAFHALAVQPTVVSLPPTPELVSIDKILKVSILIADKLPLFRRGLVEVLAQTFASCPLYEAATADELLALASHQRPALVLLAANLAPAPPDLLALLQQLRQRHEQVITIVFIDPATSSELTSLRLLRHKVSCLLTRAASPLEVCASIRVVLQQGQHGSEHRLLSLTALTTLPQQRATGGFSARQMQVLRLIAEDLSNEEIADCLCTSVRTVEYHRSQMLHKAGIRTTLGLVLFAQRRGLLPLPTAEPSLLP